MTCAIASEYAVSRCAFDPSPYRASTAPRYPRSHGVAAAARRASGVAPSLRSATRPLFASCSFHTWCVYVSASPQYAIAKRGSSDCASRKAAAAAAYSKLCRSSTPRMNAGWAAVAPEAGEGDGSQLLRADGGRSGHRHCEAERDDGSPHRVIHDRGAVPAGVQGGSQRGGSQPYASRRGELHRPGTAWQLLINPVNGRYQRT